MIWDLTQSGAAVTDVGASITNNGDLRAATISGTVSGNTLTFTLVVQAGCPTTVTGTATVGGGKITGTFSGQDCTGLRITNGQISLSIRRMNIAGTWSGQIGDLLGQSSGTWTWQIHQQGPNITGTVTVPSDVHADDTGALSGTLHPGPNVDLFRLTFTITFSGRCAGTVDGTTNFEGTNFVANRASGRMNGSVCKGPVNDIGFVLTK
jgi:hypothetical protein